MITTNSRSLTRRPRRGMPAPDATVQRTVLSELEHLLREDACPVCREVQEAERRFVSWLEIESYTSAEVQAQLRAAMGMCPSHARQLIEQIGQGNVMNAVAREALLGAAQRLQGESQSSRCPACEAVAFSAEHTTAVITGHLADPANVRAYREHVGLCVPHVLEAAAVAEPAALRVLVERLLTSLHEAGHRAVVLLCGEDPDTGRRARYRHVLPEEPIVGSTLDRLSLRLKVDACPVCLAQGSSERAYIGWFRERSHEQDRRLRNEPGELCSSHLHDLTHEDESEVADAIERKRVSTVAHMDELLDRLAKVPPTPRRRRPAADDLGEVRDQLRSRPHCSACHAADGIERSQLELVKSALALGPTRERYERGHGLCARHALKLSGDRTERVVQRHAAARLSVLTWEVQETARRYAWAYRHEVPGPEQDAWLRALAQIDGRVFAGGPACNMTAGREVAQP